MLMYYFETLQTNKKLFNVLANFIHLPLSFKKKQNKQASINNYNIRITLVVIRMEKLKKTIRDLLYMRFVKSKQNNKKNNIQTRANNQIEKAHEKQKEYDN